MRTSDSVDLYSILKRDEELHRTHQTHFHAIPFKINTSKYLVPTLSQVLYADGYSSIKEDNDYEKTLFDEEIEIPCIGSEISNCELAETITFDIPASSTRLPLMCKMIIYQQGATHEREPPILVRDVGIQIDGKHEIFSDENCLQRSKSNDHLFDSTMKVSMTDDDNSSIMTANEPNQSRISRFFRRQIDRHFLSQAEFYSIPFYQYRGHRYGQRDVEIQTNESETKRFSVTVIFPIRNHENLAIQTCKRLEIHVPISTQWNHTTVGFISPKHYVTNQRTFGSQVSIV